MGRRKDEKYLSGYSDLVTKTTKAISSNVLDIDRFFSLSKRFPGNLRHLLDDSTAALDTNAVNIGLNAVVTISLF